MDLKRIIAEVEAHQRREAQRGCGETLAGGRLHRVDAAIIKLSGKVILLEPAFNSRVDAGAQWLALLMGSAAGTPANYMALSTSSLSILKSDTTLTGETAAAGLARALATYGSYVAPSTLNGSAQYQLTKTFTNTSNSLVTILSAALFNAASVGTMFVEANLSASAPLSSSGGTGDSLAMTWTVNE